MQALPPTGQLPHAERSDYPTTCRIQSCSVGSQPCWQLLKRVVPSGSAEPPELSGPRWSRSPADLDPSRIERPPTRLPGQDHDPLDNRLENGALTIDIESRPRTAELVRIPR